MSKANANKTLSKVRIAPSSDTFIRLRDLQNGERIPLVPQPPLYAGYFRMSRQAAWRSMRRYGILRDGRFHIYTSHKNADKNRVWRVVDLTKCIISYRSRDRRILFQNSETYKLKVPNNVFQEWIDNFRTHRLYGQAKLASTRDIAQEAPTPAQVISPSPNAELQQPIAPPLVATKPPDVKLPEPKKALSVQPTIPTPVANVTKSVTPPIITLKQEKPAEPKIDLQLNQQPLVPKTVMNIPPTRKTPVPVSVVTFMKQVELDPQKVSIPNPTPMSTESLPPQRTANGTVSKPVVEADPVQQSVKEQKPATIKERSSKESADESNESIAEKPEKSIVKLQSSKASTEEVQLPQRITWRTKLPAQMGQAPNLFRLIMSAIGKDVMRMALPVSIMEPLGTLQVFCEEFEYSELIDTALSQSDPVMRMVYICAFAVSRYGSTARRAGRKPFNPLLGETFEYRHPSLGWKFLSEQVSHHPPVTAVYAEGRGWRYWHDCELLASLSGFSARVTPSGHVYLRLESFDETYTWSKVSTEVTGILSGKYVINNFGEMAISCPKTKLTGKLIFKKEHRGDIEGQVIDEKGQVLRRMSGNWTDSFIVNSTCIWRVNPMPPDHEKYYGFTCFALSLNEIQPDVHGILPRTDSRLRPDQRALEMGRADEADKLKSLLEERQRKRRKANEAAKTDHSPLWFKPTGNKDAARGARWMYTGNYWEAKKDGFKGVDFLDLW